MDPLTNPVADRMRSGLPALGLTLRIAGTPEMVRVARASGHHFVRIDTQHSTFDLETIAAIAGAGLSAGFGTVVRASAPDDPAVGLILDTGIGGVIYPDIDGAEQARDAVALARFPPRGNRSYGGSYPHFDYRSTPVEQSMADIDAATLVGCMIESTTGLENVTDIAAVPGIDLLHLGMSDLLISMGRPGAYDDPAVWEALDRIVAVATEHGLFVGCGGAPTPEHQAEAIRRGALLVTTKADVNFTLAAATSWVEKVIQRPPDQI